MYVKHARPTCTIAPIIDVGEKCPAYMQAAPEPPFCILLNSLNFRVKSDKFLQNTPKVNGKLIILVIIFNAIVRKMFWMRLS